MELTSTHVALDLSGVRLPTTSGAAADATLTYSGTTTLTFSSTGSGEAELQYRSADDEGDEDNDAAASGASSTPPGTLIFGSHEVACHWDSAAGVQVTSIVLKQGKKQLKVGKVEPAIDRSSSTSSSSPAPTDLRWIAIAAGTAPFPVDMYGTCVELILGFKAKVSIANAEGIYAIVPGVSVPTGSKELGTIQLPSMLATQFEVTHARKAFPCLDFPFVKSQFSMSVVAFCPGAATASVLSGDSGIPFFSGNNELAPPESSGGEDNNNNRNNNGGKRNKEKHTIAFTTQPSETRIPMYVASFVLFYAPMICLEGVAGAKFPLVTPEGGGGGSQELTFSSTVSQLPLRCFGLKGTPFPMSFTMKVLEHSLCLLTQFFQLPLSLRKLDLVVVPKMSLGGMEHEGLIYINETVATGSGRVGGAASGAKAVESEIARLVVHEVTHHWVGNWIGCPFAAKEGICQVLEESLGDVVIGLPMRKRKATAGGGVATVTSGASTGTVEEGKELTGQTYQLALAATAEAVAVMGWSAFQEQMSSLVNQHYDTFVGWSVFREALNL